MYVDMHVDVNVFVPQDKGDDKAEDDGDAVEKEKEEEEEDEDDEEEGEENGESEAQATASEVDETKPPTKKEPTGIKTPAPTIYTIGFDEETKADVVSDINVKDLSLSTNTFPLKVASVSCIVLVRELGDLPRPEGKPERRAPRALQEGHHAS